MTPPRDTYDERLRLRRERFDRERRRDNHAVAARALLALAVVVLGWLAIRGTLGVGWAVGAVAAFAVVAFLHARVLAARERAKRAVAWYAAGIDRLEDRWAGTGRGGLAFRPERHAYASALDLFGKGSLFERVDGTRTGEGAAALARWLLEPADAGTVRARQEAVRELRDRLDLREDLALAGDEVEETVRPGALRAWAAAPVRPFPVWLRIAAPLLGAAGIAALGLWFAGVVPLRVLVACVAINAIVGFPFRARVLAVVNRAEEADDELGVLAAVLARLEAEQFSAERLVALRRALDSDGDPPSKSIARLARLSDFASARRNLLVAPIAALALWTPQMAMALEGWRARHGEAVPRWLDACGEIEALASIAGYAFENPDDPFPEIVDGPARFEAAGLGHPLIPRTACIVNDVALGPSRPLLLVSGSNMSGKSTLLRSVGIAAVMAQAGLPVRASRLVLSPLAVGATLRIVDSLRDGTSRFYAEITRIHEIVALAAGSHPALFLLDEMLAGTNSHDRAAGAEAILRGLVARGAVGLATTHDLALVRIADAMAPRAANVHFEDRLEDGRLVFDYRLREGTVTRSNAIALMRSVGIDV